MTTLITGATGFIGSHVTRKLVERGERVRVLLRRTSKTSNIEDLDVERVYGDILDKNSLVEAIKGCDTLFHAAGLVSSKRKDHRRMEVVNISGTKNVLSTALESGVKRVVYTSSIAAIGVDPNGGIANEETPFTLEKLGIPYINTKHFAEREAMRFYRMGLPIVIVNPSVVIGPGDIYLASNGVIIWHYRKGFLGYTEGGLNLVDVEDVAEGHILALERGRPGERYILGNENLSVQESFALLEKATGKPIPKRKFPHFLVLTLGFLSERILKIPSPSFVCQDVDSAKAVRLNWYFDSSKAVRDLGIPQTPIEQTLTKTVEWYKDNGYLDI